MHVTVRLYATLRRFEPPGLAPGETFGLDLPAGSTIGDLENTLRIPPEETKLAFLHHRPKERDWVLTDGDDLAIFPPIGGG